MNYLRLGVNIDHVATLRNARGGNYPDPLLAAKYAYEAGADGITAHLREDRRHISDKDIKRLIESIELPLNLEMAPTEEMVTIAINHRPNACCLVPEKRQELTTEGGLDLQKNTIFISKYIEKLKNNNIKVSLFIDPDMSQIHLANKLDADIVELHTGEFAGLVNSNDSKADDEYLRLNESANYADSLNLEVHAGHGLNYQSALKIAKIECLQELNIGHFIIVESIFSGLDSVIRKMKSNINSSR
jgi:pyridoxine 5-phosphate synthase